MWLRVVAAVFLVSRGCSALQTLQVPQTPVGATGDIVREYSELGGSPYKVTYNGRSMQVGGKPVLLMSGSVHYPRSTPAMWPSIFAKMKAAGMNAVESYVFWNYHYPTLESWNASTPDYTDRGNVTLFLELAAEADLFVIWRIGPYICAEWPGGGYPDWLRTLHAKTRTATQPYQNLTYTWMHEHIEHVRPHFAENGGPIIMLQMDNELSGKSDSPYVVWLGELADELKANLPWIMCHGAHANNTIETCNGCDCTNFVDGLVNQNQPAMWSEDEQWFDRFGQGASIRHTGDLGRGTAAFIAVGGSMHNYYMFHGGTMWGNWSTTVRRTRLTPSYANSANLASDSIINEPKYSTIGALHKIILQYSPTILHTPVSPDPISKFVVKTSKDTWYVTLNGSSADGSAASSSESTHVATPGAVAAVPDPPITFAFNDGVNSTTVSVAGKSLTMAGRSSMILDKDLETLWYSEPTAPDTPGQPYIPTNGQGSTKPLTWRSWNNSKAEDTDDKAKLAPAVVSMDGMTAIDIDGGKSQWQDTGNENATNSAGTWYAASFDRPANLPEGAQVSVNMTGFGQGNLFMNGVHVAYFNLQFGECFSPPGGVNHHGSCLTYFWSRCDKPTQDCYHVPPEWLQDHNEMLVWSEATLPVNVTAINPERVSVAYRVDPKA